MNGLAVESFELWESLDEKTLNSNIVLGVDAEIVRRTDFNKKIRKIQPETIFIRNAVASRLNRIILESGSKLQNDYLESLSKSLQLFYDAGVDKIMLDFDLPSVFNDKNLTEELKHILNSIKGMIYEFDIAVELMFRLPQPEADSFLAQAAFFRQKIMHGINYAVDIHIHEAGFNREEICDALLPVQYDISSINFVYDAALGNKINPVNLKKIADFMNAKGVNCSFSLCPSGNINYQTVRQDIEQWFNIFEQKEG